jgi:hypothetical protein
VTSAVATPEADPIFDALAQAALDRGFGEDQIAVGSSDELPGGYVLNLQRRGRFVEMAVSPQTIEDAMSDVAAYMVGKLATALP